MEALPSLAPIWVFRVILLPQKFNPLFTSLGITWTSVCVGFSTFVGSLVVWPGRAPVGGMNSQDHLKRLIIPRNNDTGYKNQVPLIPLDKETSEILPLSIYYV